MTDTRKQLILIPGDGVGPEVFDAMRPLIELMAHSADLNVQWGEAGSSRWQRVGSSIDPALLEQTRYADAVLFGAEDTEGFGAMPPAERPASALIQMRKAVACFANLRPVRVLPAMEARSPLRPQVTHGADILIVRELLGGLYFGQPRGITRTATGASAVDTMAYDSTEIERVARVAFELARQRSGRLCSVDKANVLSCSHLWREVVTALGAQYPDVKLTHMYVDNCATQLIQRPTQFDVIVTENTFGDILSDGAAVLAGSIGMLPSAALGSGKSGCQRGLYEPVHGSAPDIAGKGIANPLGTVLSLAMALRYSLDQVNLANDLERAVAETLESGVMTRDLGGTASTSDTMAAIVERLSVTA